MNFNNFVGINKLCKGIVICRLERKNVCDGNLKWSCKLLGIFFF